MTRRFVVFDLETTGLDPRRDRIVSIGAVAVRDGEILLDDGFEAVLRVDGVSASVVVHGITPDESRHGRAEAEAVGEFLDYLDGCVLVGHHVGFDREMLRQAAGRLGRSLPQPALDTMRLALALAERGALELGDGFELDALCRKFRLVPHDRHTAPGDALLTAQVFLHLLRRCDRVGLEPLDCVETDGQAAAG
jgi:DNA polymerase-3 subunit epsilon